MKFWGEEYRVVKNGYGRIKIQLRIWRCFLPLGWETLSRDYDSVEDARYVIWRLQVEKEKRKLHPVEETDCSSSKSSIEHPSQRTD